jgi:hypothetical protein
METAKREKSDAYLLKLSLVYSVMDIKTTFDHASHDVSLEV